MDDSSSESDDDIVLDQSLTTVIAVNESKQPQQHMHQPSHPNAININQHIPPTIVRLVAPTLRSNKNNNEHNRNLPNKKEIKNNKNSELPPPPPIPFHSQVNNKKNKPNTVNSDLSINNMDNIIRPSVDPKLLYLMNLNDNNGDQNTFYDLDLENLTDKPWNNKSNTDITDWFNYGFNEETWRLYCNTQVKMRIKLKQKQFNPNNNNNNPVSIQQIPTTNISTYNKQTIGQHQPMQPIQQQRQPPVQQKEVMQQQQQHIPLQQNEDSNKPGRSFGRSFGICFDFKNKGHCSRGANCRWSHDAALINNNSDGICFDFQNKGFCSWGSNCRWKHNESANNNEIKPNKSYPEHQQQQQQVENVDDLQQKLISVQHLLGQGAPKIPEVVSNLLNNQPKKKNRKRKRRSRSRSRSRSGSGSESVPQITE